MTWVSHHVKEHDPGADRESDQQSGASPRMHCFLTASPVLWAAQLSFQRDVLQPRRLIPRQLKHPPVRELNFCSWSPGGSTPVNKLHRTSDPSPGVIVACVWTRLRAFSSNTEACLPHECHLFTPAVASDWWRTYASHNQNNYYLDLLTKYYKNNKHYSFIFTLQ